MKEYLYLSIILIIIGICVVALYQCSKKSGALAQPEVSALEDLMREHGVLHRLLLIYQEYIKRLQNGEALDCGIIEHAAGIIQQFIEGYHEKDEENYLFPRFQKSGVMVDLVKILLDQHEKGRAITVAIKKYARDCKISNKHEQEQLIELINSYIAMYYAHAAREDTELYPAFYSLVSAQEYKELAELFEQEETEKLGEDGFNNIIQSVAALEKQLGISNLDYYTPASRFIGTKDQ